MEIALHLQCNLAEHQIDWEIYLQLKTYVYIIQIHRSTFAAPLSLTLMQRQPIAATVDKVTAWKSEAYLTKNQAVLRTIFYIESM